MQYLYYPGCSMQGAGRPYEESLLAVCEKLGVQMRELPEWNCCGATAYMSVDENKAFALAARNLALAEREGLDLVAPCNACYLVLNKVQKYMQAYDHTGQTIRQALAGVGLSYEGTVRVRHPLDVFCNDISGEQLDAPVTRRLEGLKVACYYGCQVVRPFAEFDDQYDPQTMDKLMGALGAETIAWPLKARCCGGTLTGTIAEAGQRMSVIILREARRRGADVIATACPLCQFNLECYQDRMHRRFGQDVSIPVVYFTQLMGRAMGLDDQAVGLQRMLAPLGA